MAGRVEIRVGDLFSEHCDVIVLPSSRSGTITSRTRADIETHRIPPPRYKKALGETEPLTSLTATILPDLYVGRRLWPEGRVQSRHLAILVARLRFIRRYCPAFRLSLLLLWDLVLVA